MQDKQDSLEITFISAIALAFSSILALFTWL